MRLRRPAGLRRRPRAMLAAAMLMGGVAVPAALADGPGGGDVIAQCYSQGSTSVDDGGYKFCRSVEAALDGIAAACRAPLRSVPPPATGPADTEKCAAFDGRAVS